MPSVRIRGGPNNTMSGGDGVTERHKKFFYDHFVVKGAEAAAACAATVNKVGRLLALS